MKSWLRLRFRKWRRVLRGCLGWWVDREIEQPTVALDESRARRREALLELRDHSREHLVRTLAELERSTLAPLDASATVVVEGDRAPLERLLQGLAEPDRATTQVRRDVVERVTWTVPPG